MVRMCSLSMLTCVSSVLCDGGRSVPGVDGGNSWADLTDGAICESDGVVMSGIAVDVVLASLMLARPVYLEIGDASLR